MIQWNFKKYYKPVNEGESLTVLLNSESDFKIHENWSTTFIHYAELKNETFQN